MLIDYFSFNCMVESYKYFLDLSFFFGFKLFLMFGLRERMLEDVGCVWEVGVGSVC